MNRTPPRITLDTPLGDYVDLERDDIRLADGTRLTDELVEQLTEDFLRAAGRPSLTAPGKHSPSVTIRLPEPLAARLDEEVARTGKRRSDIVREALIERLAG